MMMPPIDVPWPPMNFVSEWTTTFAPYSIGRSRYGVAIVLSMMSGRRCLPATAATASMSSTSTFGLPIVSAKIALVFSRTARPKFSAFAGSTSETSMPRRGSVCMNALYVPPYSDAELTM